MTWKDRLQFDEKMNSCQVSFDACFHMQPLNKNVAFAGSFLKLTYLLTPSIIYGVQGVDLNLHSAR